MIKTHSDEDTFVTINVVKKALACLNEKRILILIGTPGIGKSRIGIELLRILAIDREGHTLIQLDDISQWYDMCDGMDVVFIDDVFGRTNCCYNDNTHSKILHSIFTTIQNKSIKVILTLRKNIYQTITTMTDCHRIFHDQHVLDLSSDKNQMTVEEKESCLIKYLMKNNISVTDDIRKENISENSILDTDTPIYIHKGTLQKILHSDTGTRIGFPVKCYLFASHRKFTMHGHYFFRYSAEQLSKEIDNLRIEGNKCKRSMVNFTLLVYILLNGDSINKHKINKVEFEKLLKTLYSKLFVNIPTWFIYESAEQLKGKYLKINSAGNYCFQHILISEAVMKAFCFIAPRSVIPLIGFDFITEMTRPQVYKPSEGEVIFSVPPSCYSRLAQRLLLLLGTNYRREPYQFVQNMCKSAIITMTSINILNEMIKQYKYNKSDHETEVLRDLRFSGSYPYYSVSTSYFYLPSALLMFCDIDFVPLILSDNIINNLKPQNILERALKGDIVMNPCKETLMESFQFAICTLDVKRSSEILKILKDHNIKLDVRPLRFCHNIVRCQGLPCVQLLLRLPDLWQVFNINSLLSQIFRLFIWYGIKIEDNMKHFITSVITNNYDSLLIRDIVKFVCKQGQLNFVKNVCERFNSRLFDVDGMILQACKGSNTEVIEWLVETYHGSYNVQKVLNEACYDGSMEGVQIIFNKFNHTLLNIEEVMNMACCNLEDNIELVNWLCKRFGQHKRLK